MFFPRLSDIAAFALQALAGNPSVNGDTLHAVPFDEVESFMLYHPDAVSAKAMMRTLEAADEYESADDLQRSVWEMERSRPGCVAFCTDA